MIVLSHVDQKHSDNLNKHGIKHDFSFQQIRVNVKLSPDKRVNEILGDMVKKLAGLKVEFSQIAFEPKMDGSINNSLLIIEQSKIGSNLIVLQYFKSIMLSNKAHQGFSRFRERHNLNSCGIFPYIKSNASEEILISSNREDMVAHDGLVFNFAVKDPVNVKSPVKVLQHRLETIMATPLIKWYFDNVSNLKDQELLWFITNIIAYKNAKTEIGKLKRRDSRIAFYYKLALDMYLEPLSYKKIIGDDQFPYDYLYQAVNSPIVKTMRIKEAPEAIAQEEISRQLESVLERFIDEMGEKILLLRVDTGSGKTMTIGDLFSSNMAYVGPTHKLIMQFMKDVLKWNKYLDVVYIPAITDKDIPECDHKNQMKYHEQRGEYKKANEFRDKAVKEYGSPRQQKLYHEYKEALKKKSGSPFITHSRLINNGKGFFDGKRFEDIDTIVIDEDILPSLFPSTTHTDHAVIRNINIVIEKLEKELNSINGWECKRLKEALTEFIELIKRSKVEGIVKNEARKIINLYEKTLGSTIKQCRDIKLNLFNILKAETLTCKINSKWESTIYTHDYSHVLRGKKIIVMSATLDESVHLELFRKRINLETELVDMPRTEIKGRIICHTDVSTTKNALSKDAERVDLINRKIQELGCIDEVITYKDWKNDIKFKDISYMHFYNTAGYNDYSGKNLAIVGTPNNIPENAATLYFLIYGKVPKSVYFDKEKNELVYDLSSQPIVKDEFKFSFFTFNHAEDERARSIHIWSTYNELLQAVGRARLTHHDCEVHVFSRLPIPQCTFSYELAQ